MTTLFYKALLLQGEIWWWSLLGFKGLEEQALGENKKKAGTQTANYTKPARRCEANTESQDEK